MGGKGEGTIREGGKERGRRKGVKKGDREVRMGGKKKKTGDVEREGEGERERDGNGTKLFF